VSLRLIVKIAIIAIASLGVIVILFVGLIRAVLFEPWPISKRQGPDTAYAKTRHEKLLGGEAPRGVQHLFAREEWGFGGDSIDSLWFGFEDRRIVAEFVAKPQWKRVRPEDLERLRYLAGPKWWPAEKKLRGLPYAYEKRNIEVLWVDRAHHQAYFQQANFCCALAPPAPVP